MIIVSHLLRGIASVLLENPVSHPRGNLSNSAIIYSIFLSVVHLVYLFFSIIPILLSSLEIALSIVK